MDELQQHHAAWHQIQGVSDKDRRLLLAYYSTPEAAYAAHPDALAAIGLSAKAAAAWRAFGAAPRQHAAWAQAQSLLPLLSQVSVITTHHPHYPPLLREIPDYPPLLYVRGDTAVLTRPQLAVVGSRRCSHNAQALASSFAKHIAAQGTVITSGGALGIDAAAHRGALSCGATIAVIGTGIDGCYPPSNAALYNDIADHGAIVSEFRPRVSAKPGHFPRRNRIIAGMSHGTLVVEAALRSGSLITARLALDYNREVFAIPGPINDPRSKGCHALIKQGAKLTETADDIFEEFAWSTGPAASVPLTAPTAPDGPAAKLLACIDYSYTHVDDIAARAGEPIAQLLPQLLELELAGCVVQEDGGYTRV